MQSLNRKNIPKKRIFIITGIVVAVLLASFLFWYIVIHNGSIFGWSLHPANPSLNHSTDYNKPTSDQIKNGAQIKTNSLSDSSKNGSSGSDVPPAPTPSTNGKSIAQMSITATNQTNSAFQIRTLISALSSGGTCTLTMTKSGSPTVTMTAAVQNLSNTSTCQGFDVPISQLSSGMWNITINFNSVTLTGSAADTVTIQ